MIRLITRSDDAGSSKGANLGIFAAAGGGFIRNISLMAPGPQIKEAAALLKGRRDLCFGLHFTMNAEWDRVKWHPVSPEGTVASLVDHRGDFYPDPMTSAGAGAMIEDIHREWCAQLDLLTHLGFDVRYADTHMFPELAFEGLGDAMSEWIREKGLVDHRYFYRLLPHIDDVSGQPGLFDTVAKTLEPGQYFYLTHPAAPTKDMYLAGNDQVDTRTVVAARRNDLLFAAGLGEPQTSRTPLEALDVCEKYGISPTRYDEMSMAEGNRDSILAWR